MRIWLGLISAGLARKTLKLEADLHLKGIFFRLNCNTIESDGLGYGLKTFDRFPEKILMGCWKNLLLRLEIEALMRAHLEKGAFHSIPYPPYLTSSLWFKTFLNEWESNGLKLSTYFSSLCNSIVRVKRELT